MRRHSLLLALAFVGLAAGADRLRARMSQQLRTIRDEENVYALPPPPYVKVASLGYQGAVASVLWAATLYQYGYQVGRNKRFSYATQYVNTITFLDPAFSPAYRYVSTFVTMQAVNPAPWELEETRQILRRGTEALPTNGDVWGAYATFLLYDGASYYPEKERAKMRVEGAPIAQRAVELGFQMHVLSYSGALFLERAGETDLAIAAFERAYAVAQTEQEQERILRKLRKLMANAKVERMRDAMQSLARHHRQEAPFLDSTTFTLVGPARDVARCAGHAALLAECQ